MPTYIVQGEKDVDVDIVGTVFKPGQPVVLQEDVAAPLLESGKIVPGEAVDKATEEAAVAPEVTQDVPDVSPAAEVEAPAEETKEVPVEDENPADGEDVPTQPGQTTL